MERRMFAEKDDRWCEVTIRLEDRDGKPRLAISGAEGSIITRAQAKREALRHWESYFEENPAAFGEFVREHGCRTPLGAARKIVAVDGEFHGLDVHQDDGKKVYIAESCGQIRKEIAEFFPEVAPYFKWHLNNMHAECAHQEARGETWEKNPHAVCPDCGWRLGHGWSLRELPPEVITWAKKKG